MEQLITFIQTPKFLITLWAATVIIVCGGLMSYFSNYRYGYRAGLRILKSFGQQTWKNISNKNKTGNMTDIMDPFRKEITDLAVSNKLNFWNGKIADLELKLNELQALKEGHELSMKELNEYLDDTKTYLDGKFGTLATAIKNDSLELEGENTKNVSFEDEFAARRKEIEQITISLTKNIGEIEETIKQLKKEHDVLIKRSNDFLAGQKIDFGMQSRKLKSTIFIWILFIVEFAITFFNFDQIFQFNAAKHAIWAVIPWFVGIFFPLFLIAVYSVFFQLKDQKWVLKKILFYLFITFNLFALIQGLYLFAIAQTAQHVDEVTNVMFRYLLFPVVLVTIYLLEDNDKDRKHSIIEHVDFLFVIPQLLISGMLIFVTTIFELIRGILIDIRYSFRMWKQNRHKSALLSQKDQYQRDLERFYTEYIEGLAEKFKEKVSYQDVLDKIRENREEHTRNLHHEVQNVVDCIDKETPEIDKKIKEIKVKIKKHESNKHEVIEGVDAAIKKNPHLLNAQA